jgi:uncharacterized repeat protein (TIGR01451 family)
MSKLNLQRNRVYARVRGNVSRLAAAILLVASFLFAREANTEVSSPGISVETLAESRRGGPDMYEYVVADRVRIGEEIFYTLRVRNETAATLDETVVIRQIPRNTQYVAGSAVGPAALVTFSTDGANTFASPEDAVVMNSDGTTRAASPSDYTHIRWQLRRPLAAGATALLRFRGVFK